MPSSIVVRPKKKIIFNLNGNSYQGYQIDLNGISFFVTKEKIDEFSLQTFISLDNTLKTKSVPCIGIIETGQGIIKPVIWVKAVNTITIEKGCTTGVLLLN
jgi:hypothetical protein